MEGKNSFVGQGGGSSSFNWIQQVWVQVEMQLKRNLQVFCCLFS